MAWAARGGLFPPVGRASPPPKGPASNQRYRRPGAGTLIPRLKPWFGLPELRALLPVRSDSVERFEADFAQAMGASYALAFPYGRSALYALLRVLGCEGIEVVLPAYTCVVVAHAVVCSGNIPRFVDVSPCDFNMDLNGLAERITPRTRVVLATSMYGYPVDVDCLNQVVGDRCLVIQDCALAVGTTYRGRPMGSFGRAAIYGLNVGKQLSTLQGGMATTDDPELHSSLKEYRDRHFRAPSFWRHLWYRVYLLAQYGALWPPAYGLVHWTAEHTPLLNFLTRYYREDQIELPGDCLTRLAPVQGMIGSVQLKKCNEIVRQRREIAAGYDRMLAGVEEIIRPPLVEGASYSHYSVQVNRREDFVRHMERAGINTGTLFDYAVPELSAYRPFCQGESFPWAEQLAARAVNLPNYPGLSTEQVERISRVACQFCPH